MMVFYIATLAESNASYSVYDIHTTIVQYMLWSIPAIMHTSLDPRLNVESTTEIHGKWSWHGVHKSHLWIYAEYTIYSNIYFKCLLRNA